MYHVDSYMYCIYLMSSECNRCFNTLFARIQEYIWTLSRVTFSSDFVIISSLTVCVWVDGKKCLKSDKILFQSAILAALQAFWSIFLWDRCGFLMKCCWAKWTQNVLNQNPPKSESGVEEGWNCGWWCLKIKFSQNHMKHISVSKILKHNKICPFHTFATCTK